MFLPFCGILFIRHKGTCFYLLFEIEHCIYKLLGAVCVYVVHGIKASYILAIFYKAAYPF